MTTETIDLLPPVSAHRLPSTGETIIINRGESGYIPMPDEDMQEFNKDRGVTPAQAEAMFVGSMFGWDNTGADPRTYDDPKYAKVLEAQTA